MSSISMSITNINDLKFHIIILFNRFIINDSEKKLLAEEFYSLAHEGDKKDGHRCEVVCSSLNNEFYSLSKKEKEDVKIFFTNMSAAMNNPTFLNYEITQKFKDGLHVIIDIKYLHRLIKLLSV